MPQWSPVMKTGNTGLMRKAKKSTGEPQWSPVMKTGNTGLPGHVEGRIRFASMEPGHEDREYRRRARHPRRPHRASMEPGHEDREYGGVAPHSKTQ